VAVSADGSTAIIGGPDNGPLTEGAAWVFTRTNGLWSQQGQKLVGTNSTTSANQGWSVAISADGNTAAVGGPEDNNVVGATWVFVRSNGVWAQQAKLVGTGGAGQSQQGISAALSGDGNTLLAGGQGDNGGIGAAWVFTRSGQTWTQQAMLSGATGLTQFGASVALSNDGNTAVVGGPSDGGSLNPLGAMWIFVRSNGSWAQQGPKLVGTGSNSSANQGTSVALSSDGNTAILGGPFNGTQTGAAWIFTRTNGSWTQQGSKLVGTGATNAATQGTSVALSGDGNTALVGAAGDNSSVGATWVFTRRNGAWAQQGQKLVGQGFVGPSAEGKSVALSTDGRTAIIGAINDNNTVGAAWVFMRKGAATHDFDGNGVSDIAWRDTPGDTAFWLMNGTAVVASGGAGLVPTTWSMVGQRDFNGDGMADLLWRDSSGNTAIWLMNGTQVASSLSVGNIPSTWTVVGTGDFNGDGMGDLLWQDNTGNLAMWLMNGATVSSSGALGQVPGVWRVAGIGDFNGDGFADILWRDTSGNTSIWFMNGTQVVSAASVGNIPAVWQVVGTGDFNGDGMSDIVWRDTSGNTSIWLMNGATVSSTGGLGNIPTSFSLALTGDFNGDNKSDLLWRDSSGNTSIWYMNGTQVASMAAIGNIPTVWTVQSTNAE
jgi:FG-GAP-like repeat